MKLSSEDRVKSIDPVFGRMGIEAGRHIWEMPELTMRKKTILVIVASFPDQEFWHTIRLRSGEPWVDDWYRRSSK